MQNIFDLIRRNDIQKIGTMDRNFLDVYNEIHFKIYEIHFIFMNILLYYMQYSRKNIKLYLYFSIKAQMLMIIFQKQEKMVCILQQKRMT